MHSTARPAQGGPPETSLASLGATLARLDGALAGFRHAAMYRPLHWDLRHIALALEHLSLLSAEQRNIVQHFRAEWEQVDWSRGSRTDQRHRCQKLQIPLQFSLPLP